MQKKYNILLIGEYMADIFHYGNVERISPEAPVMIFKSFQDKTLNPGGAGNVYENIKTIGGDYATPFTQMKFDVYFFKQKTSIIKNRYIDKKYNQIVFRVDEKDEIIYEEKADLNFDKFCSDTNLQDVTLDAIIVSDYGKGFLDKQGFLKIINKIKSTHKKLPPIFMDTKMILGEWSKCVDFVKINNKEYLNCLEKCKENPKNLCKCLITTHGEGGIIASYKNTEIFSSIINNREIFSVCGAGDSVLAALVVYYLHLKEKTGFKKINNQIIQDMINFANIVGNIAVSKPNVHAVTKLEIKDFIRKNKKFKHLNY